MDDAICSEVATDMFFPESGESAKEAKRICASCPVVEKCLQYALHENIFYGVWGGTSPHERRNLKKAPVSPSDEVKHATQRVE